MKSITIGMDLGDKKHVVCILDAEGNMIADTTVANDKESIDTFFFKHRFSQLPIRHSCRYPPHYPFCLKPLLLHAYKSTVSKIVLFLCYIV